MAKFSDDFSLSAVGQPPSGWTGEVIAGTLSSDIYVVADAGSLGGKSVFYEGANGASNIMSFDAPGASVTDCDILMRVRVLTTTPAIYIVARFVDNDNQFIGGMDNLSSSAVRVRARNSGAFTNATSAITAIVSGDTYYFRKRVTGSLQEFAVWPVASAFPGFQVSQAAPTAIPSGKVGFGGYYGDNAYIEWFSVGTGGDTADNLDAPATPTIDTVPATAYPGQTITITGTSLTGASADYNGETCAVTVNSSTEIEVTIAQGDTKYATHTLTVTTAGGSDTANIELIVEPGTGGYVDVVSPETTDTSAFAYQAETAGGDPVATGDQFEWRYTGVLGDPTSMTVQADTLPSSLDAEGDVEGRFWDATDSTWGAWYTFTAATEDTTAPTVSSVSVPTAGTYAAGDALSFTVNWSEAVDVTGTPALNLTIGGSARQANYASGTGTSALVFSYTVQSGDEGAVAFTSLTLDGGTIKDAAGNDADLTLNSVGDTSGVLVDGVGPVISIFPLTTLDTTPIVSGSAGDATSLTLVVTGVGTYNPTPSGGTWSQQLPTLALGDYTMTLNGQDAAGNAAVEDTATLRVVSELIKARGMKRMGAKIGMGL